MARWHKERAREAAAGVAPTREDVIFDIQQVMTLLVELKHEPHGGGRHAATHGKKLAELVHTLHTELHGLPKEERQIYNQDIDAVVGIAVDGKEGRTLGEYIEKGDIGNWGKDYASNWENPQNNELMRQELREVMQILRESVQHRKG